MIPEMPREVTLLYFSTVRDAVGTAEESLTLPGYVRTVRELSTWLEGARPELAGKLGGVRFAVNEAFAEPDAILSGADIVAVIPPVSGG